MIAAVLAILTLGSGHYIAHCRNAPEGCQNRVTEYVAWAVDAAQAHDLDPRLILAVAIRESGMDPAATGSHGEHGVYQLHPRGAGARALRMCRAGAYPLGYCRTYVAAQELSRGLSTCDGSLEQALGYYNSGKCISGRYARKVLAIKARL